MTSLLRNRAAIALPYRDANSVVPVGEHSDVTP